MAGIAENLSNPVTAQRTMGVDLNKEVSDRVKTYRSNPRKLQERYQMSQELLDLLALQQIKSEQAAIANDMKLKQAAMNPEANMTTKEKLAQNVVGTKTQEMASQIGGAYANMNKKRKAAMNKLATNVARRPAGITAAMPKPATKKQGLGTLQGTTLAAKSGGIMPKFAGRGDSFVTPVISPPADLNTNVSFDDIIAPTSTKVDSSAVRAELKKLIEQGSLAKAQDFITKFGPMLGMSQDEKERMLQRRTAIEGDLAKYETDTASMFSPEAVRKKERDAILRGIAQGGIYGGLPALTRQERATEASKADREGITRGLRQNLFKLDEGAVERNVADRRLLLGLAADQVTQTEKNRLTAISQNIGLDAQKQAALSQDANLLMQANIANLDADMKAMTQQHLLRIKNVDNDIKVDVANQSAKLTMERLELDNEIKNLQLDIEEKRNEELAFQQLQDIAGKMDQYSKAAIESLTKIKDIELANLRIKRNAASGSAAQDAVTDLITQRELQHEEDVATMLNEYNNRKNAILARLETLSPPPIDLGNI